MRIGLIADTHEVREPLSLIARLGAIGCQRNVHLGDIAGSWAITEMVRRFKREDNLDALSEAQKQRYAEHRGAGLSPVAAYIEAFLGDDVHLRGKRKAEIEKGYSQVAAAMRRLPGAVLLAGNVDNVLLRVPGNRAALERQGVHLLATPEVLEDKEVAILAWPSSRHCEIADLPRLCQKATQLAVEKGALVVLAHEQLFRGPTPASYRANAAERGWRPTTIPHFEPNPSWPVLLDLFRSLPASVLVSYVSGHVHDPQEVLQAGARYLKGTVLDGMVCRLWGFGGSADAGRLRGRGRRLLRHFHVPAGRVAVLNVEATRTRLTLMPPLRPTDESG